MVVTSLGRSSSTACMFTTRDGRALIMISACAVYLGTRSELTMPESAVSAATVTKMVIRRRRRIRNRSRMLMYLSG